MLFVSSPRLNNPWEALQEPPHPANLDPRYGLLLAALDSGWQVEEPVYLRLWCSESGTPVFQFLLRHPISGQRHLAAVPAQWDVERFVRAERLRVVDGDCPG